MNRRTFGIFLSAVAAPAIACAQGHHRDSARKHFQEVGVDTLVDVVVGDAHENVKRLTGPIDLLFLDADKEGYADYLKTLLPLVRPGGLIAADNIGSAPDYYKAVTTDPQLETVSFGRFAVTLKKR